MLELRPTVGTGRGILLHREVPRFSIVRNPTSATVEVCTR